MLFNSWTFVVFIIPVLGCYYFLPFRWQNRMLLVASCIFYATWDWRFLFLLAGTTSIDYFVALRIRSTESLAARKWLVGISCGMNLLVLAFFKYFNFFIAERLCAAQRGGGCRAALCAGSRTCPSASRSTPSTP